MALGLGPAPHLVAAGRPEQSRRASPWLTWVHWEHSGSQPKLLGFLQHPEDLLFLQNCPAAVQGSECPQPEHPTAGEGGARSW